MTKANMMREAHKLAKTFEGDYTACLALALRTLNNQETEVEFLDILDICKEKTGLEYIYVTYSERKERFDVEEVRWVRGRRKSKWVETLELNLSQEAKELLAKYSSSNVYTAVEKYTDDCRMDRMIEENDGMWA